MFVNCTPDTGELLEWFNFQNKIVKKSVIVITPNI